VAETLICPVCRRPADASGRATCRCAEVEVLPRPVAQPDEGPDPADLAMFEKAGRADDDTSPLPAVAAAPRRRRRVGRGMALAVGGIRHAWLTAIFGVILSLAAGAVGAIAPAIGVRAPAAVGILLLLALALY